MTRQRNLLLSDIAHDIKTPLTTLCSYSKALSDEAVQERKDRSIWTPFIINPCG